MPEHYLFNEEVIRRKLIDGLLCLFERLDQRRIEMKKSLLYVMSFLALASLVLTSCGAAPATQARATEAAKFTCALITPNPWGDGCFIDASARGIKKANEELRVKCDIIEANGVSEHETALRGAIAQKYDLVLGLAMDTDMFVGLAKEFPDQK